MAINEEQARAFAEGLLAAGREPSFVLSVLSAYWGETGQEAAFAVLEANEELHHMRVK